MKKIHRKLLSLVLGAVFLISAGVVVYRWFHGRTVAATYSDAANLAMIPMTETQETTLPVTEPVTPPTEAETQETTLPPEPRWVPAPVEDGDPWMETLAQMDLEALRQVNPDVVGWIIIPETPVNYPILQGQDNQFYLNHTWEGKDSRHGSIFLECRSTPDFTDFNTIIYGHNMADKSMFGSLHNYILTDYPAQHPYVYIVTDQGVLRYEIFSTYSAPIDGMAFRLSFRENATREAYLEEVVTLSEIQTDVALSTTDRYLTLVTCTGWSYSYRRVVHARLSMIEVTEP